MNNNEINNAKNIYFNDKTERGVNMKKLLLFTILVISIICIAENMTFIVGKDEGSIESIQEAIDRASDGDTIYIKPGVYQENIVIKNKAVKIIGESPDVRLEVEGSEASPVVYIEDSEIELANLTIFASGTIAVMAMNSTVVFRDMNLILGDAVGVFLIATGTIATENQNVACFKNVNMTGVKTEKRVGGSRRIEVHDNRGIISLMDYQLYVFNSRFSYLQVGITTSSRKTLISDSEFLYDVNALVLVSGNNLVLSNKFHKAIERAIVLMGNCRVELTNNSFADNTVDLFLLNESCDCCPSAKKFTGSIEGKFNIFKHTFIVQPEDTVLPSHFIRGE
ncbi:MAG: hypothetical protein J7L52_06475 [Thermotogae bacterium]|nr:hypothetical protein [Thermotogota bacterium]